MSQDAVFIGLRANEKMLIEYDQQTGDLNIHPTGELGVYLAIPVDRVPALIAGVYNALRRVPPERRTGRVVQLFPETQ